MPFLISDVVFEIALAQDFFEEVIHSNAILAS